MIGQETTAVLSDFSGEGAEPKIASDIAQTNTVLKELEKLSAKLRILTGSTSYNRDEIMSCSTSILSNATDTDQSLKQLFKSMHAKFQSN